MYVVYNETLTEDGNSGINYASFIRLNISSRISFLAQVFELLSVDRLQGKVYYKARYIYHEQNGIQATDYERFN